MRALNNLKQKAFLLMLLIAAGMAKAQSHEFAPVGAEWYYSYGNIFTTGYIRIKAVKDTIIDGTECVKLEKREYGYSMDPWGIGPGLYSGKSRTEYVTSTKNKVYLYRNQTFNLWFDFDAEVGDSWPIPPPYNVGEMISDTAGFLIVEAKGTEVINGKELRYIDVIDREGSEWGYGDYLYGQSPYTVRIYERIGPIGCYLFPETHEAAINTGNTWIGELDIPSEIEYNGELFTVTGIAQVAFGDCEELTKVRIPKTINHIVHGILTDDPNISGGGRDDYNECMNPFWRCTALESIEVDADNPIMSSDDGILFSKDKTQLYSYPSGKQQETYIIPENITWIGNGVFSSNVYLSSLTMPNSVAFIGGDLCSNCVNLKSVRLSESITFIPAYAFDKCESLTLLDIPESVQEFGESVFRWTHLKKLVIRGTFPNGLRDDTFMFMDEATVLYVQQSEIEKFKKVFSGTVLPLEEYTSNIEQVKQHQQSAPLYDLQGRRLTSQPSKGVYIQSGKKVVVK